MKNKRTYKDNILLSISEHIAIFGMDEINNPKSQKMIIEVIHKNFSFLTIDQFLQVFYSDERIVKHF